MPKEEKNRVTVEIHGHKYSVVGKASTEHLQQVAHFVNSKMREIEKKSKFLDTTRVAVLTAINVADDYIRLQEEYTKLLEILGEQTKE